MSECLHVEKSFLDQLAVLGGKVTNHGQGFGPSDATKSLRTSFREWFLAEVFRASVLPIGLDNCQIVDLRALPCADAFINRQPD